MLQSILFLSAIVLGFVITEQDEPAVEIPLDQIWALNMPGTKDIRDLENRAMFRGMKMADIIKNSLVENTKSVLSSRHAPPRGQSAGTCFIVVGTGLNALKDANAVLTKKKGRLDVLPPGKELTLVFFSYSSGRSMHLDRVTRSKNRIELKYHFHAHPQPASSRHVALIPLGKFTPAVLDVMIERLPDTSRLGQVPPLDEERVKQLVCQSCTFQVSQEE